MNWFTGVVVFLIIWWVVLFAVLPWGVRRVEEPEEGHDPGAPEKPLLARKFLATTVISAVLWGIAYVTIESDLFSFREMVQGW
jgi:predicted secreted protein